jgi:hypothetical protein
MRKPVSEENPQDKLQHELIVVNCEDLLAMEDHTQDIRHVKQMYWCKFVKLHSMDQLGLTEGEFFGLFVKCDACALITTRQMFTFHYCDPQVVDDSELTTSDSTQRSHRYLSMV